MPEDWLRRFHDGERALMEECYRDHYDTVERAVGRVLASASDRETAVHEVFLRLLTRRDVREGFGGGSLAAWLGTVARNLAIDCARAWSRERAVAPEDAERLAGRAADEESALEARLAIERFRRECLPAKWQRLFELRFLERKSQREAAAALGIARMTLIGRELRVRRLLRRFLLGGQP